MNIEEIKMDHFENFEELIKTCKLWIEIDDIDAYYRFFEFNCMKAFVTAYEKEKEKNKNKDKILRNIRDEFLKYNWKDANPIQTYNQVKSLYESIYCKPYED